MHPILFRIGEWPVGTYGLVLVVAFFLALWVSIRQGRKDQLNPESLSDLAVAILVSAILGAKVLMVVVELSKGTMRLQEVFSMEVLRSGGVIHGGILGGLLAAAWKLRPGRGLPFRLTLDALVPGVALGQAIGRLGCLSAGCCYGSACSKPWAITFTHPDAALISGTPLHQPLHPIQLYQMLGNGSIFLLLLFLRKHRRFQGQVGAAYFIFEGVARILFESWRGDLDRGVGLWGQNWLTTGRLTGFGFLVLGAVLLVLWRNRPAAELPASEASAEAGKA